jgi:D-sedoheptulose 7-phosphate isomerase
MAGWQDYVGTLAAACDGLRVTSKDDDLSPGEGLSRWIELTQEVHRRGGRLYLIGNGASAAIASHFAADACKTAQLRALTFNDAALLTAASNDVGFDEVFALPLRHMAQAGDMLISISSSGSSPNIVQALAAARAADMVIVTLSGRRPDNPSRSRGDLNFYVPAEPYAMVETAHALILHYWIDHYVLACEGRD